MRSDHLGGRRWCAFVLAFLSVIVLFGLERQRAAAETGTTDVGETDHTETETTSSEGTGGTSATVESNAAGVAVAAVVSSSGTPTRPAGDNAATHPAPAPASGGGGQQNWPVSAIADVLFPGVDAQPICVGVPGENCLGFPALDGDDLGAGSIPEGQVAGPPGSPAAPAAPAPYVPSPAEIAATIQAAYDNVSYPDLTLISAPPGDLDAPFITQLATFLWVDAAQWQPITASASIPGHLTVTATSTPTTMWWSGGETGPIQCAPPGIPWYPGAPEECTMTYKTSSATNNHHLELTVVWEVTYVCSAFCGSGTLAPITRVDTRPVRVAEIQSIVTAGG